MKKIVLPWHRHYSYRDVVCIASRKWSKVGRCLTVCGLIATAVGYYLTVDSTDYFTEPGDYEFAREACEETLGYLI